MKGRKIPNLYKIENVSPSSDFLKGVLFNVIGTGIRGKIFCDLYAGSGSIGFEALSRGAAFCIFAETSPDLIPIIIKLSKKFDIEEKVKVIKKDVLKALEKGVLREYKPDYIFIDPPYNLGLCEKTVNEIITHSTGGGSEIIVQHDKREALLQDYPPYKLINEKIHGKSALSFYRVL
ncbi:MAG: 23S rRNA (adenine(2030)-N(6))-methyltransferase RlmJ [Deltaproteobacteria bacterium]|nr:23S rRNA (adenine(2030)-N(6))-methyltransferase RlmJ [Deltaproteobacteria bacterium]